MCVCVCCAPGLLFSVKYLVPVLTGVVDLLHRTGLENINESTKRETHKSTLFMMTAVSELRAMIHSLAQHPSILQALHEVVPDPLAGHILNPQPQLLFLLWVILPSQLRGWGVEQGSEVKHTVNLV